MNNDPSLKASNQFLSGRRFAALVVGGSALLSSCSIFGNDDSEPNLNVGGSTIEATCDAPATPLTDYRAEFGVPGPFAANEAISAEKVDNKAVVEEAVSENAHNSLGLSYMDTLLKQDNASYQVSSFATESKNTFDNALSDETEQKDLCVRVSDALLRDGEVGDVVATNVVRFTNVYNEAGKLIDVNVDEDANVQKPIKMLFVRNANGAPTGGIVLDSDRNGEFVLIKNIGDQSGGAETPDTTPETAPVSPILDENGEPLPITTVVTPDKQVISVVNTPNGPIAVNPETGEPTGQPVPEGSTPSNNGENGNETGEGCGVSPTPECEEPSEEPVTPGTNPSNPTTPVPGTTPVTTVRPTPTTTGPHPTTTVRPTTTTTVKPTTTTTTVKPTTTTTVKPTTTTSTPPTTTEKPKGSVPTTTTGPGTTAPSWIN